MKRAGKYKNLFIPVSGNFRDEAAAPAPSSRSHRGLAEHFPGKGCVGFPSSTEERTKPFHHCGVLYKLVGKPQQPEVGFPR